MHKLLLDIPRRLEAGRVYLRRYEPGDGDWFYLMSQKNRAHLAQYEAGNVVLSIKNVQDAEVLVRELAIEWEARNCFFMGVFRQGTNEFVAQIYVGPTNWDLPEFSVGYFVDRDYEGQGYVTESVLAALSFTFNHLQAHRVRIECDDTNERSWQVAERCGLIREGHIRENKINAAGEFTGTLFFGLLRSEYEAQALSR